MTDEQNKKIKVACEQLLIQVQRLPEKTEIAYHLDYETMEIISSSEGGFGDSKVTLRGKNKPFVSIHNHPSNTIIGVLDIEKALGNDNEMLCAVIGNNGKFSAVLKTKSSNEFLYQQFINKERKKKLYNHITFGDFLYNNQVLFKIPKNKWDEVYNLVDEFQYNVAKKGGKIWI